MGHQRDGGNQLVGLVVHGELGAHGAVGLHTADQQNVGITCADHAGGVVDTGDGGAALHFHEVSLGLLGQTGQQSGIAGQVGGLQIPQRVAAEYTVHLGFFQNFGPLQKTLHNKAGDFCGCKIAQTTAHITERGAGAIHKDNFSHKNTSL